MLRPTKISYEKYVFHLQAKLKDLMKMRLHKREAVPFNSQKSRQNLAPQCAECGSSSCNSPRPGMFGQMADGLHEDRRMDDTFRRQNLPPQCAECGSLSCNPPMPACVVVWMTDCTEEDVWKTASFSTTADLRNRELSKNGDEMQA